MGAGGRVGGHVAVEGGAIRQIDILGKGDCGQARLGRQDVNATSTGPDVGSVRGAGWRQRWVRISALPVPLRERAVEPILQGMEGLAANVVLVCFT